MCDKARILAVNGLVDALRKAIGYSYDDSVIVAMAQELTNIVSAEDPQVPNLRLISHKELD